MEPEVPLRITHDVSQSLQRKLEGMYMERQNHKTRDKHQGLMMVN